MLKVFIALILVSCAVSCTMFESAQPRQTTQTLLQQIVQDNKDSIKDVSKQLSHDFQVGFKVRQLYHNKRPSSDSQYAQLGEKVAKIVSEVETHKVYTDAHQTLHQVIISITCLCLGVCIWTHISNSRWYRAWTKRKDRKMAGKNGNQTDAK